MVLNQSKEKCNSLCKLKRKKHSVCCYSNRAQSNQGVIHKSEFPTTSPMRCTITIENKQKQTNSTEKACSSLLKTFIPRRTH